MTPLSDPFLLSRGSLMQSGLYPNGSMIRPAAHEAAGQRQVALVRPRDSAGVIDERNGRVVLLSIGMSNTTQEFQVFERLAAADSDRHPQLVLVDGAQGGWSADRIVAEGEAYWATVNTRLGAAQVAPAQVQAAWIKQADRNPTLPFPDNARLLQSELETIAQELRRRYPNLRLLYLSSRIYAGYASTALNPEPHAYQSGFAVKSLIEAQIQGSADLNFEAGRAPWLSWGPYLWADGMTPRDDGLTWSCADFETDGTHPSPSGERKVGAMLLNFFKTDSTTRPWFVRAPAQSPPKPDVAAVVNAAGGGLEMTAYSIGTILGSNLAATASTASGLPLPTVLGNTIARIGGEPALLYFVSPGQINFVVPKAPADVDVIVLRDGVESSRAALTHTSYAPGVFTQNGRSDGPAAALDAAGRLITSQAPARAGDTIMLFLTGLGVRNPLSLRPEILPAVRIGGALAAVVYSGSAPGWPGLNQINLVIPADTPPGAAVPLVVELGASASNTATLAVR